VHERYKIPIGPWAKDPLLKEIGMLNFHQVYGGLEGLTFRLYTKVLNWSEDECRVLMGKVREDLKNPRIHAMFDL
jgi:hypothetical protein